MKIFWRRLFISVDLPQVCLHRDSSCYLKLIETKKERDEAFINWAKEDI